MVDSAGAMARVKATLLRRRFAALTRAMRSRRRAFIGASAKTASMALWVCGPFHSGTDAQWSELITTGFIAPSSSRLICSRIGQTLTFRQEQQRQPIDQDRGEDRARHLRAAD